MNADELFEEFAQQAKEAANLQDFGLRMAKVFNETRSSSTFFLLQKAYPEYEDEWEWGAFQVLLNELIKQGGE